MTKVFICIPYYRSRNFFEFALASVLGQSSAEWELAVVDDSGDRAEALWLKDVLTKFSDPRISYESNNANQGIGYSWNRGLDLAAKRGLPLVTILHEDDELSSDYVKRMIESFKARPDLAIVVPKIKVIDGEGQTQWSVRDAYRLWRGQRVFNSLKPDAQGWRVLEGDKGLSEYVAGNFFYCPSLCYNLAQLKDLRFDTSLKSALDFEFYTRILLSNFKIGLLHSEPIFSYRRHGDSTTEKLSDNNVKFSEEQSLFAKVGKAANEKEWPLSVSAAAARPSLRLHKAYRATLSWWVPAWLGLAIALYFLQYWAIAKNAVDVPWGDEWSIFRPGATVNPFGWDWIFAFHNEHRIVFSKMLISLFEKFHHLDFASMAIASYAVYGVLLFSLWKLFLKQGIRAQILAPFFVFFMSSAAIDNFVWSFQSCFHFVFLFFAWALLVFDARKLWRVLASVILFGASMFSLSLGVTLALGVVASGVLLPWKLDMSPLKKGARQAWISAATLVAGFGIFAVLWSRGYQHNGEVIPYVWPWHWRFWQHFLGTLAWLFGSNRVNDGITIITTLLLIYAFYKLAKLWCGREKQNLAAWLLTSYAVGVVISVGIVSLGRASFGAGQGKASRYEEIVVMLLPLVVWALSTVRSGGRRLALLTALWFFCLLGHGSSFFYFERYGEIHKSRMADLDCVVNSPDGNCPADFPNGSISARRSVAEQLGANFMLIKIGTIKGTL